MFKLFTSIVFIICLVSCTGQRKEMLINSQKILYDSANAADKSFQITVITILEYQNSTHLTHAELESFYMLAATDTLDLRLENIDKSSDGLSTRLKYKTFVKKRENEYNNITFVKNVESWEIKNRISKVKIKKDPNYKILALIALWENNNPHKIQ
ncbi:hypothetical protein [Chryseobacterium sp. A321]